MKRAIALLLLLSNAALGADWNVCWQPPTQYTDGTPLLEQDLDFYTLFIDGNEIVSFDSILGTWCYTLTITEPGTYEARLTVTDINGMTSERSNATLFTVGPRTPEAPTNLTVEAL